MNKIANDIRRYIGSASLANDIDILQHEGVAHDNNPPGRGSGRYAYGSGKNSYQRIGREFYDRYCELSKQGLSESEIAKELGCLDEKGVPSTGRLRQMRTVAKNRVRIEDYNKAVALKEKGMNNTEIAKVLGYPGESSVRSLLDPGRHERAMQAENTANELKSLLEDGYFRDVGKGVAQEMGISNERMEAALYILQEEGYLVKNIKINQATNPGQKTTVQIIAPPGTDPKDLRDYSKIKPVSDYESHDGGDSLVPVFSYPASMDSSRLAIRYSEDGGENKDGVIEIRRGVDDLSLGKSNYAQVRILVDGTHYLKGMAVYSDNLPEGKDVLFNTNKTKDIPMIGQKDSVLKKIKDDPQNPFGSLIKPQEEGGQYYYEDANGKKKLGLINKTREEGEWNDWQDKLPSQFLSKQPQKLIDNQLNLSITDKKQELAEISAIQNPTLKKKLLEDFAGKCDTAAVELKAASLPGQKYHVILPLTNVKENEIYAPNYPNGTKLALVRFPHAGTFEIPVLTVNNKNKEGIDIIGPNSPDAVGISAKAAKQLSGADFDGDTVMCIPTNDKVRIESRRPFKELQDFDPHYQYAGYPGMKVMTKANTQREMGKISNLITDMQIQGATDEELIRATKHSMVVIDAEKHKLDYRRSEKENDIQSLKEKYQKQPDGKAGGASTIISKAKSPFYVPKRQGAPRLNDDGTVWYKKADDLYYKNKKGELIEKQTKTSLMAEKDPYELISDMNNPVERAYANYASVMKSLATQARKEYVSLKKKDIPYSKAAYNAYKDEIDKLLIDIKKAEANGPKERAAQTLANANAAIRLKAIKDADPDISDSEYKSMKRKINQQEIQKAREKYGAKRAVIDISDAQWNAINQGAINKTTLNKLFRYCDMEDVKRRAIPRENKQINAAKVAKMRAMMASGYTNKEIAEALGVSVSTIIDYVKGN